MPMCPLALPSLPNFLFLFPKAYFCILLLSFDEPLLVSKLSSSALTYEYMLISCIWLVMGHTFVWVFCPNFRLSMYFPPVSKNWNTIHVLQNSVVFSMFSELYSHNHLTPDFLKIFKKEIFYPLVLISHPAPDNH